MTLIRLQRRRTLRFLSIWIVLSQLLALSPAAYANPRGGSVASGSATISQDGSLMTIHQATDKAIINWQGFSNSAGETVRFAQPSASAATLNRVTSSERSVIDGALQSNGRIFLINPNGVLFGKTATVNTGGLIASTLSITDEDFQSGNYRLAQDPSRPMRAVVNQGNIQVAAGGSVALIAPIVNNEGVISAASGQVALAAGTNAVVTLDEGLVSLGVRESAPGAVVVSRDAVSSVLEQAVNNHHLVDAGSSSTNADGEIVLGGAEGLALNQGTIRVDAADGQGGGRARVDSTQVSLLAPGSAVTADGSGSDSNGGAVQIISQGSTLAFAGSRISARGGDVAGDGGQIELSAPRLMADADIDAGAGAGGQRGTVLFDPDDIVISHDTATNVVGTGDDDDQLNAGIPNGGDAAGVISAADGAGSVFFISDAKINAISAAADVALQATGSIVIDGVFNGAVAIVLGAGAGTGAGLSLDVTGDTVPAFGTAAIEALGTGNSISTSVAGQTGLISLASGTATANGNDDINITGLDINAGAGNVSINSAGSFTQGVGEFIATGGAGTVAITAAVDASLGDLSTDAGNINVTAGSHVLGFRGAGLAGATISSRTGDVVLTGLTNDVELGSDVGGIVTGNNVSLIAGGGGAIRENSAGAFTSVAATTSILVNTTTITNVHVNAPSISVINAATDNHVVDADVLLGANSSGGVLFIPSTRDILNANGGGQNVTASEATLAAVGAIGGAEPIHTAVDTLNASGASISIREADGVTLGSLTASGTVDVTGVSGNMSLGAGGAFVASGSTITLTSAGDLTLDADFNYNTPAPSTMRLNAANDVVINNQLRNTATGFFLSVFFTADSDLSGAGNVTFNALVDTAGGDIRPTGNNIAINAPLTAPGGVIIMTLVDPLAAGTASAVQNVAGGDALTAFRMFLVGPGSFSLTESTNALSRIATGGNLPTAITFVDGQALIVGDGADGLDTSGSNGSVSLTAPSITFARPINAGTGTVLLTAGTGAITGDGTAQLEVTAGNLGMVAATNVGAAAAVQTAVTGALSLSASTAAGSAIVVDNGAAASLTDLTIALADTGVGVSVVANTGDTVTMATGSRAISGATGDTNLTLTALGGTLDIGGANLAAGTGTITLDTQAAITQTGALTAASLRVLGAGAVTLDTVANDVDVLAASRTAGLRFKDGDDLILGTVASTVGLTLAGDTLIDAATTLDIQKGISNAAGGAGTVFVVGTSATQSAPDATDALILARLSLRGTGSYTLTEATNNASSISAPLGAVGTVVYVDSDGLDLGDGGGEGFLTNNAAASITAGGPMVINEDANVGSGNLTLDIAGALTQQAGDTITAAGLELLGAGTATLADPANNVGTLAANKGGAISFRNAAALSVGTVNTAGITTSDDNVTLQTSGDLTFTSAVDLATAAVSAGGSLFLNVTGAITQAAGGSVQAAGLEALATGNVDFRTSAANDVQTLAGASTGGFFAFNDVNDVIVGTVGGSSGITDLSGADIQVTGTNIELAKGLFGDINTTGITLTTRAGGAATQTAGDNTDRILGDRMALNGPGAFVLDEAANNLNSIAAVNTGPVTYADLDTLNVGFGGITFVTAAGQDASLTATSIVFNEITNVGGNLTLNLTTAASQASGKTITAGGLELLGAGTVTLTEAANDLTTVAASFNGAISLTEAGGMSVGTVLGTSGIVTTNSVLLVTTGSLAIDQLIAVGAANLSLSATGAITQAASISGAGLELLGTGTATLGDAGNAFTRLAVNKGGAVSYTDSTGLDINVVQGTAGITTSDDSVTLRMGGDLTFTNAVDLATAAVSAGGDLLLNVTGTISQAAGGSVQARGLEALASGNVDFTGSAANDVQTLAGRSTAGTFAYTDASALAVGTVGGPGTIGITTTNAAITLESGTAGATFAINNSVNAGSGAVQIVSAGAITSDAAARLIGGSVDLSAAGAITANTDTPTVAAATTAAGGITLNSFRAGGVTFGALTTVDGAIGLSSSAGTLTVGGALVANGANDVSITSAGNLAINADVTAAGDDIVLSSGALVSQTAGSDLAATGLQLVAGSFTLSNAGNAITNIAGASAALSYTDLDGLTVGTVNGVSGLAATGAVNITAQNGITVGQALNAGANAVTLTSVTANLVDTALITAGAASLAAPTGIAANLAATGVTANAATSGGIAITNASAAAVNVASLNAGGAGSISFAQSGGGAVTFGAVTSNSGAVTLSNAAGGVTLGANVTAGGAFDASVTGNGVAIGANLDATGNTATVNAGAGSVSGAGRVTASVASFTAGTAVGSAADPMDTTVGTLSAVAGAGGVFISETDALTIGSITSTLVSVVTGGAGNITTGSISAGTGGSVVLNAGGSLLDGNAGGLDITALSVNLTANEIGSALDLLDVDAGETSLTAAARTGGVFVQDPNGLKVASITAPGNVVVVAGGALTVNSVVAGGTGEFRSSGDLTLGTVTTTGNATMISGGNITGGTLTAASASADAAGVIGTIASPLAVAVSVLTVDADSVVGGVSVNVNGTIGNGRPTIGGDGLPANSLGLFNGFLFFPEVGQGNASVALATIGVGGVTLRVFDGSQFTLGSDLIANESGSDDEDVDADTEPGTESGSGGSSEGQRSSSSQASDGSSRSDEAGPDSSDDDARKRKGKGKAKAKGKPAEPAAKAKTS